jgi:DNA-binding GntR family transcriptional regulator
MAGNKTSTISSFGLKATSTTKIKRLAKSTLRVHIVDGLREAILNGDIPPGAPVVESNLAEQFGVSRGPLREAIRQLIEDGLLVTVPYTGTHVTELSVEDVREIYSIRIAFETFAFEQIWTHRKQSFFRELNRRNAVLTNAIDAGDDRQSITAELDLHGLAYETSGHRILLRAWIGLRGRLQLYWAAHHRAHGMRGPRRDGHDSYVEAASGTNLEKMRAEIQAHMLRGARQTEQFLQENPSGIASTRRVTQSP